MRRAKWGKELGWRPCVLSDQRFRNQPCLLASLPGTTGEVRFAAKVGEDKGFSLNPYTTPRQEGTKGFGGDEKFSVNLRNASGKGRWGPPQKPTWGQSERAHSPPAQLRFTHSGSGSSMCVFGSEKISTFLEGSRAGDAAGGIWRRDEMRAWCPSRFASVRRRLSLSLLALFGRRLREEERPSLPSLLLAPPRLTCAELENCPLAKSGDRTCPSWIRHAAPLLPLLLLAASSRARSVTNVS